MAVEIPMGLVQSTLVTVIGFFITVWLITHISLKNSKLTKEEQSKFSIWTGIVLVIWFSLVYLLGDIGFISSAPLVIPNIIFLFVGIAFFLKKLYDSDMVRKAFVAIPMSWIIGIQVYRVVGIGFLNLLDLGLLPAVFALPAGYGDILVGVTAPFVAAVYYFRKSYSRKLAIIWNIVGLADLFVAIGVGIFAFTWSFQFVQIDVSTNILSLFPMILVPGFAVPIGFLLHFLGLRELRKKD